MHGDPLLVDSLVAGSMDLAPPELAAHLHDYLARFGDRCTEELKLESLTLHDDPTPLWRAIGLAAARRPPEPLPPADRDPHDQLRVRCRGRPWRLLTARLLITWAKARVRDRENLRFERTRLFGRVRRIFLAIGRRLEREGALATARDIFYLEVPEVLGWVEGRAVLHDLKGVVAMRQQAYADLAAAPPPPARFETVGAVAAAWNLRPQVEEIASVSSERRQGTGCCRGVVQARVRVIHHPRSETLAPGEILVARHTDPGWIALFSSAAGILVERGSLLSHSAIVAREMGIPAIVAIPGLMAWLASGESVIMDGEAGTVVRVNRHAE